MSDHENCANELWATATIHCVRITSGERLQWGLDDVVQTVGWPSQPFGFESCTAHQIPERPIKSAA
jgi:hypothetical protein